MLSAGNLRELLLCLHPFVLTTTKINCYHSTNSKSIAFFSLLGLFLFGIPKFTKRMSKQLLEILIFDVKFCGRVLRN